MKKQTLAILLSIAILTAAVIVLAVTNAIINKGRVADGDKSTFIVQGQTVDRELMDKIGLQTISANKKSDGKPAAAVEYQGTLLLNICNHLGIDIADMKSCVAMAADGYSTVVSVEKVNEPDNIFIVLDEDEGPFIMVVAKDPFSQNWCKYLVELTFK
jgi:hypothetical protein